MAGGSKKKTKNMILLLVALVVVIAAYAVITLLPEKEEETVVTDSNERTVLVEMEDDAVIKLEYIGENSSMELVYEDETWYRADDREFPVNQTYAGNMAGMIAGLTSTKTINETPESLADYGLAEPKVWVRITDNEGNTREVRVGMKSPKGDGVYVSVDDEQVVYLATTTLQTQFAYTENQMIAKHSTPTITTTNITQILVEKPDGNNVELVLDPENEWNTTGYMAWVMPQGFDDLMPANTDKINALVEHYASFTLGECQDYKCEDPAEYGLDQPTHLELVYYENVDTGETNEETGEAITEVQYYNFGLKFGSQDESGNYYVQLDGTESVYTMSADAVTPMIDLVPYDYVHRLPGLVNIKDVDRVIIEYGNTRHEMSLEREIVTELDDEGNEVEEEEIYYYLDGVEVDKKELTDPYMEMIGVVIDGLVDEEVAAEASDVPVLTLTYERGNAGLDTIVTEFYEYNDNFNRMSVNGVSIFRCNIRDVESIISMCDEIFAAVTE